MPRQARLDYPGALHHVIARGIEKKFIFKDDSLKTQLYNRIKDNLDRYSLQCYAWCIMGNHFHLLVQSGKTKISEFMRSLLTGYAVYYNRRNKRSGHLFQNRYKSVLCEIDQYLLPLIRYIHLNPVKAGIVGYQELEFYKWTGHREICRGEDGLIGDTSKVLDFFGDRKKEALQTYKSFMKDGQEIDDDFEGGGLIRSAGGLKKILGRSRQDREMYDERILGSGNFVEEVLDVTEQQEKHKRKIKSSDVLLRRISLYYNLSGEAILGTREYCAREARDVFMYMGRRCLGMSVTELGRMLGIGQSAASQAVKRARTLSSIHHIEKEILTLRRRPRALPVGLCSGSS